MNVAVKRSRRFKSNRWFLLSIAVLLAGWQVQGARLNPVLLSTPARVAKSFVYLIQTGELPSALLESLRLLIIGYTLAASIGIGLGLIMGRYPVVGYVLDPWVSLVYSLPKSALTPLLIIWMGIYLKSQIFVVFLSAVLPTLINTYIGVRNIDPAILEVAKSYMVPERLIFTRILLPAATPSIISGLRMAAGDSAIGVITAELFLQATGLGGLVRRFQEGLRMDNLMATILVVAMLGYGLTRFARYIEKRSTVWSRSMATGE